MIGIIKDLVVTPLIVLQMLLVGPLLWANQNHPNRNYKGVNKQNARDAKLKYGQQSRRQKQYGANQGPKVDSQETDSKYAAGQAKKRPKHQTKAPQKSKAQIQAEQENMSVRQRSKVWADTKKKEAQKAARPYVKKAKDTYKKAKYDANKALNNSPTYQKVKAGAKAGAKAVGDKASSVAKKARNSVAGAALGIAGSQAGYVARDLKDAWNNQEYVGPVEDYLYTWDEKAKNAYANLKAKANAYFEDKYRNGQAKQNYFEYYQKAENGVVEIGRRVRDSKVGNAWRRQSVIGVGNDIQQRAQEQYYLKTATFYNQQADEKLKLEAGNPAMQILSAEHTRQMINVHFNKQVKGWIEAGHYKQVAGNRQLAEMLSGMYERSIRETVMQELGISAREYKAEFGDVVKRAIKAQEKEMRRSAREILQTKGSWIYNPAKKTKEWVVRKIEGRSEKEVVEEALGVNEQSRYSAINKSIPLRSLKLWPIETLYFNIAIVASAYIHSAMDSTYNPLYRLDNEEQARHGFNPFGWAGIEMPFLEAMGLGFFGFIITNQAFQKYAPYIGVPKIMRGYVGMGLGSIASSVIEQIMMHPGHKMFWDASQKYSLAMMKGNFEEADKWASIMSNAKAVMMYDITNSKFWKDQIEHVIALIGSSMAAMLIGVPYDKIIKNNAARRYQAVKNNPHLVTKAAKAKNVVNGRVFSFAMAAKDVGRGALYLLGSHPVARIVHFTAFLFMDPVIRPMAKPMVKHMKAEDAYDALNEIRTELPKKRKLLADKVYFDRRVLDIYEGKEAWYKRYSNLGDYQEKAATYWLFKDYYDAKSGYRAKQTEALAMSHGRWKEFLQKFMVNSEVAQALYSGLEEELFYAQELYENNKDFQKGMIKPEISNLLNFSTYSKLPADTKNTVIQLFDTEIENPSKAYAFDEANLAAWQTDLYETDLKAYDAGGLVKHLKTDYNGNTHVIWMRNGLAEKMLFNMVFGKGLDEDHFEAVDGHFPKFHAPRVIRELPYGPKDTQFMKLDEKHAFAMENGDAEKKGVSYTYFHPLTKIKFLDPDDSKYKNIIQLIYDRALPETKLGSKDYTNPNSIDLWMEKHILCKQDKSIEEIAEEGAIKNKNCSDDSIREAYNTYKELFAKFIRDRGADVLSRTSHQSESGFSQAMLSSKELFRYFPMLWISRALADANPSLQEVRQSHINSNEEQYKAFEAADFSRLQTGNENPYISLLEDIVAASGFLQTALPSPADYDQYYAGSYHKRASQLQAKSYQKYLQDATHLLMTHYLDALTAKDSKVFMKKQGEYTRLVDEIEQTYNKAMCYLHDRPVELATQPKTSGVVQVNVGSNGGRFYRLYNPAKDTYTYTKIGKNAFCDFDQIQHQINLSHEIPSDAQQIAEDEETVDLSQWVRWFQTDGKEALSPEEADLKTLRAYFGLGENDHAALAEKIMDAVMIDEKDQLTAEDLSNRHKMEQKMAEYLELSHDIEEETRGELGDMNLMEEMDPNLQQVLAQAQNIEASKIKVVRTTKIVPTVSLRTAIASKSVDMLRKIMAEEAPQYQSYMMDLYDYAPNSYDQIGTKLCELRVKTVNVYRASTEKEDALAFPEESVCNSDYKDLLWVSDKDSAEWKNRKLDNTLKEAKYNGHKYADGFWEWLMNSWKKLYE